MTKTISDIYSELASVVNSTYSRVSGSVLIRTGRGIVVYNSYLITTNNEVTEVYVRTGDDTPLIFGSVKNALVWIILYHHDRIPEARRVRDIDMFLTGIKVELEIHKKAQKKGGPEKYLINFSKLQNDIAKQKQFLSEIDKYYILAQRCQQTRTKI
jgi:hypothetical protein